MKAANVDSWKCDSILFLIVINTEVMTKGLVHNSQFHDRVVACELQLKSKLFNDEE